MDIFRGRTASWIGRNTRFPGYRRLVQAIYGSLSSSGPIETVTTASNSMRYHINTKSYLEWHLYVYGEYERELLEFMMKSVSLGDTIIDCGANVGIHTCPLANKVGDIGRVIAIEPLEDLAIRLEANLALNSLKNTEIVRCAASSIKGETSIYQPADESTNRGMASLEWRSELHGNRTMVKTTTIDDLVNEHQLSDVRLIKIDVEGHEFDVLKGALRTMEQFGPVIAFEWVADNHDGSAEALIGISDLLAHEGYEIVHHIGAMQVAKQIKKRA